MVTGVRSWVLATFFLFVSTTFAGACRQQQASDRESAGAGVSGDKVEQRGSRLTVLSRSGWVATASGSGTNTPASNAIDASATTAWRANVAQVANTQWFQVNMGGPRTFIEVRYGIFDCIWQAFSSWTKVYRLNSCSSFSIYCYMMSIA